MVLVMVGNKGIAVAAGVSVARVSVMDTSGVAVSKPSGVDRAIPMIGNLPSASNVLSFRA